ncbi:hypothetical protein FACS1894105_12630 [Clostridia bacterium]|nr:hypothetical protein FACS1894105_12630 [Clostridia bacterium]
MHCFYCKGRTKAAVTTHTVNFDGHIIIIKNVPCIECIQCGETFYDNDTAIVLEKLVNKLKDTQTEVVIANVGSLELREES